MTYEKLFDLKFKKRLSTQELVCRYPSEIQRVSEIALLDIPEATLRKILKEKKIFERLVDLKKKFLKEKPGLSKN